MALAGVKDRQEEPLRADTLEQPTSPAHVRRHLLDQEHMGLSLLRPPNEWVFTSEEVILRGKRGMRGVEDGKSQEERERYSEREREPASQR